MNPADTDSENPSLSQIQSAIFNQGKLLGQHEQVLKAQAGSNQPILNQIDLLTNQATALTTQLTLATTI